MSLALDRTERCALLARLSDADLTRLVEIACADEIGPHVVITPPTIGMVMARVIDGACGDLFNLGEVLVTECLVSIGGHEGWSMLLGSRPQATLAAASIDAAIAAGSRHIDRVDATIRQLIAVLDEEETRERARLEATRVTFETQ